MEKSLKRRRSDDMMKSFGLKRDWSEIPGHILANVLEKLIVADDYVKFGAVCVSWRTVFSEELEMKKKKQQHSRLLPFLLIPPIEGEEEKGAINHIKQNRSLYDPSRKRVYDFKVQVPHSKWCRGSCFGWLVNLEPSDSNNFSVQLCNPFMSNNNIIHLPPLDNIIKIYEKDAIFPIPSLYLQKAVLSANPSLTTNYVVVAIMGASGRLAFFKPGNIDWISIDCNQLEDFTDILYFTKTQQFYVVREFGAVFAIDLQHPVPKLVQVAPFTQNNSVSKRYLVESLSGELLQVFKFMGGPNPANWFSRFQVFKLDLTTEGEWIQIDSLGEAVLFLGENSSLSLSASEIPGCKPNCIYFTEDLDLYKHRGRRYGPQHAAIFNLEDGTVKPHYPMESRIIFPLPIWIEPTIQNDNFQTRV